MMYEYKGTRYPSYLKEGNAMQFIAPCAHHFCTGLGLDVGAGRWPLKHAKPVDLSDGGNAMKLPEGDWDYIFSSHCLEHLPDPIGALEHWRERIRPGGVLFLYLPHPEMEYWLPQNNRKHLHTWHPREMEKILMNLGFVNTIRSERDLLWSFAVVGFKPSDAPGEDPTQRFRNLIENSSEYFRDDPQLLSIFDQFGADAFRRSSLFDGLAAFLAKVKLGGKRCVEIGTFNGITALVLARHFEEVVSIDIFPHTLKHAVLKASGVKNVRFIDVKNNEEKAAILKDMEFDAAYVDGDHVKDTVTDFELVRKCGRVVFHEYWQQQAPVWNLVNSLRVKDSVFIDGKLALWTASGG